MYLLDFFNASIKQICSMKLNWTNKFLVIFITIQSHTEENNAVTHIKDHEKFGLLFLKFSMKTTWHNVSCRPRETLRTCGLHEFCRYSVISKQQTFVRNTDILGNCNLTNNSSFHLIWAFTIWIQILCQSTT